MLTIVFLLACSKYLMVNNKVEVNTVMAGGHCQVQQTPANKAVLYNIWLLYYLDILEWMIFYITFFSN